MEFTRFKSFFNKKEKNKISILFICMLFASLLETLGLGLIFPITGIVLETVNDSGNVYSNLFKDFFNFPKENLIFYSLALLILIYFIKIIFMIWFTYFQIKFIYFFKESLSSGLFSNYLKQNFDFFYEKNSAEILRNITTEVNYFSNYLFSFLRLSLELLIASFIIFLLIFLNPLVAFSILFLFASISLIYFFAFRKKIVLWGEERQFNSKAILQFAQEGFGSLNYIKFTGKEKFFFNKFKTKNLGLALLNVKFNFIKELPKHVFEFIGIVSIILVFYFYFKSGKDISETIQILAVYFAASFRILPSINRILNNAQTMRFCSSSINNLSNEFKNFKNDKKNINNEEKVTFDNSINLRIRNFNFQGKRDFNLNNINIEIKKNQKIGIMGKTGFGKSTIIQMILGIIKNKEIDLQVDNNKINSQSRSWQNLICYVPQRIFILDDTLKKNILFGKEDTPSNNKKILEFIKITFLDKLVDQLPDGINSRIGEQGYNLSGGEIQRIAICRALLEDKDIIVLDEATSSLDKVISSHIINHIFELKNKTIIFVSHKQESLKNCDLIYSFDKSKVEKIYSSNNLK